jgi:hypothetical protein
MTFDMKSIIFIIALSLLFILIAFVPVTPSNNTAVNVVWLSPPVAGVRPGVFTVRDERRTCYVTTKGGIWCDY